MRITAKEGIEGVRSRTKRVRELSGTLEPIDTARTLVQSNDQSLFDNACTLSYWSKGKRESVPAEQGDECGDAVAYEYVFFSAQADTSQRS